MEKEHYVFSVDFDAESYSEASDVYAKLKDIIEQLSATATVQPLDLVETYDDRSEDDNGESDE